MAIKPKNEGIRTHYFLEQTEDRLKTIDKGNDCLSFNEWQSLSSRTSIRMEEHDAAALGQIVVLMAYPQRPKIGLRQLHAYANWRVIKSTGAPHPIFAQAPRKKYSEVMKSLAKLDSGFCRAMNAGRALEDACFHFDGKVRFGKLISCRAPKILFPPDMTEHDEALLPYDEDRRLLWSNYHPVIHLGMAMRQTLILSGFHTDSRKWIRGELLYNLFEHKFATSWLSDFIILAERMSYQIYRKQLLPRPEKMIHLVPRQRERAF